MARTRKPSRGGAPKPLKPRVIVVTEGTKTEPSYIIEFQRICKAANVSVKPTGFDPQRVVEKAIDLKEAAEGGTETHVWAVFDRDKHKRFKQAVQLARQNGISVATSNPCFELWAVFHHQNHAAPIDSGACQRLLERLCASYHADRGKLFNDPTVIQANHAAAVKRGKQSLRDREREGCPHGNPSTSMHLLMESIRTQSDG